MQTQLFSRKAHCWFSCSNQHLGVARDISDHKCLEDAINTAVIKAENEKARSNSILEAIGDGVSIQDKEFRVLYQNQIHMNLTGRHEGELCYQAYEKRENRCEGWPVALAYADGKIHTVERQGRSGFGSRYLEITVSPLRDST